MKVIRTLKINGITLDKNTDWDNLADAEFYCYSLYENNPYTTYLVSEVEKRYGKQSFEFVISNHNKYKREKIDMPKAFDYVNYKFSNGEFIER